MHGSLRAALEALAARWWRPRRYASFAAAAADAEAYGTETLSRFRVERARANAGAGLGADLAPAYAFVLLAVHLSRAEEPSVVDLGGAAGEWARALRSDARRRFRYTIVENPDLSERCTADPDFNFARWTSTLPEAGWDVFLSSGTLQYLAEPYAVLATAFERTREFVALGRNNFSETELFLVQRTVLGAHGAGPRLPGGFDLATRISVPLRTLSLRRVLRCASASGWRLMLQADCASGVHRVPGATVFGRDLLFARADAEPGQASGR
jgi:putative methyltransferase (TIGR04325 family)